jgi:hypothetical protein
MSKASRAGGKFTGNHTTIIESASKFMDALAKCEHVTKITPGKIKSGLSALRTGGTRIKLRKELRAIHITVRGNISLQEFYVYATDANLAIAHARAFAEKNGLQFDVEDRA